jgi:hypothetical protein
VFCDIVRRKPWIVVSTLMLFATLCSLGVFGVVYASDLYTTSQKVRHGVVQAAI